jgi:hypothetical protein
MGIEEFHHGEPREKDRAEAEKGRGKGIDPQMTQMKKRDNMKINLINKQNIKIIFIFSLSFSLWSLCSLW